MTSVDEQRAARFAQMYEDAYGPVHAYAARRAGPDAADEICADAFLVAWRRLEDVPDPPLPWLYGVARNVVARHHERGGKQRRLQAALAHEHTVVAPGWLEGSDGDAQLWTAWETLRETDRELLALIAWEELTVAEAAQALGCAASVCSVRLPRARRRFASLLERTATTSAATATVEG